MTLGRSSSGAIKIKTDSAGGGLRAVSCGCCSTGPCGTNRPRYADWDGSKYVPIPPFRSYIVEITNLGQLADANLVQFANSYYNIDLNNSPIISTIGPDITICDFGFYFDTDYAFFYSIRVFPEIKNGVLGWSVFADMSTGPYGWFLTGEPPSSECFPATLTSSQTVTWAQSFWRAGDSPTGAYTVQDSGYHIVEAYNVDTNEPCPYPMIKPIGTFSFSIS